MCCIYINIYIYIYNGVVDNSGCNWMPPVAGCPGRRRYPGRLSESLIRVAYPSHMSESCLSRRPPYGAFSQSRIRLFLRVFLRVCYPRPLSESYPGIFPSHFPSQFPARDLHSLPSLSPLPPLIGDHYPSLGPLSESRTIIRVSDHYPSLGPLSESLPPAIHVLNAAAAHYMPFFVT